jgi:thioredoxin reductase
MPRNGALRLAILGAGPIGLEAALYARQLQMPFTVYERGRIGEHLRRWGHVRLFTPFGMNATPLARQALHLAKPQLALPSDDTLLTGREHVEKYLTPLAELLGAQIKTETQVLHIGRRGFLKHECPGDAARAKQPFLLLLRQKNQERIEEADAILDCTGTYGQHRWMGSGGIPAIGELQTEPSIVYGLEDILAEKQKDYINRSVLVIGGGYSAATTVSNLAKLAEAHNTTWITWLARSPHSQPLRRLPNDPLRERDRLAARANTLATRSDANVEYHAQTVVEAIEALGKDGGFRVTCRSAGRVRTWEVERVIANVGYTPDTGLYRELQMEKSYTTLGPMALRQPEPNFFVLGAKSMGRNSQFLLRQGFQQIREVFVLLTSDARLDLYGKAVG